MDGGGGIKGEASDGDDDDDEDGGDKGGDAKTSWGGIDTTALSALRKSPCRRLHVTASWCDANDEGRFRITSFIKANELSALP